MTDQRVVRVVPDVPAITNQFDYLVPAEWERDSRSDALAVGSRVRIELHGRRIGGWIVGLDVEPPDGVDLLPLAKLSGHGPSAEVFELADWIAHRWASSPAKVLRAASPPRNVPRLPQHQRVVVEAEREPSWMDAAFKGPGAVLRIAPAADRWPVVEAALARGNPLFITPSITMAEQLAGRLRRAGVSTALLPDDWARAAGGAAVVGTRSAALATVHEPGSIVVLDEHDDAMQEERMPTWHARDVALKRASDWGVPCVLVSPTPTVDAQDGLPLIATTRAEEFAGWPTVEVIDRRDEQPGRLGLFSERLVTELRGDRRVACILNRKGRAQLLACSACGEVVACARCEASVRLDDDELACRRCEATRPIICQTCGGMKLKNLRMGVSRAREELEALVGEPVAEVTATATVGTADARVTVGTEALLHTGARFETVVFLDIDQELLALRQRAAEQALGLLARAARIVGPRAGGGRIIAQTRTPEHVVLRAAQTANPSLATDADRARRQLMSWPPFGAQALVSGQAAAEFISRLGAPLGLEVRGPSDDAWLLRADDAATLADRLAEVKRPDGRLRIEVDPPRV